MSAEQKLIDEVVDRAEPHYRDYGWHHWPRHPWMSYQFRRALGETQEGGGAISECFQAAARMIPGDKDSWREEWLRIATRNDERGDTAASAGHIETAKACWLRAADYYRQAEFWLEGTDPRRLDIFSRMEACSRKWGQWLSPAMEEIEIPYLDGKMYGYFLKSPKAASPSPVVICFGGLDSIKDEMWFMSARGPYERGISVLMIDGPGQGGTLRRHRIPTQADYEKPVGVMIDYLLSRGDIDEKRIAVCGSSLGGFYAARAASYEPRIAAAISHGAVWDVNDLWGDAGDDHGLADHITWVFGAANMAEAHENGKAFKLEGHIDKIKCPYLICHGGSDVLSVRQATQVFDYARDNGVDVTLEMVSVEETGAEHCQHDNPTIGQEKMADWLADRFGIDQQEFYRTR
ncbi:alpha/beta hydrolase [Alcanivorax sp. ZXX171]|nr:alpha/beta hydrolase [Alcanivorax sp. ZXX171]